MKKNVQNKNFLKTYLSICLDILGNRVDSTSSVMQSLTTEDLEIDSGLDAADLGSESGLEAADQDSDSALEIVDLESDDESNQMEFSR